MKIAIVTSSFPLREDDPAAAAGMFVRDFAVAVAKIGHSVHVITQDKGWGCSHTPPEIDVHCFNWPGGERPLGSLRITSPRDLWAMRGFLKNGRAAIGRLHKQLRFDHVLAMWAVPGGLFAQHLKNRFSVPYSVWCLGSDIWSYGKRPILRQVVARTLQDAEQVYGDGYQLAADAKQLGGVPVTFLPSSRNLTGIAPAQVAHRGSSPRFLFVGRYHQVKGVDVLLTAMFDFFQRERRGFLSLFGGGPERESLESTIQSKQMQDFVHLGGFADRQIVVDQMTSCDAVIIPSRMESIPVILSDALQLGKPVIVSDVGDMGTLLREISAGLVVPTDDAQALSAAFSEFAAKPAGHFSSDVSELAMRFDINQTASQFCHAITNEHSDA